MKAAIPQNTTSVSLAHRTADQLYSLLGDLGLRGALKAPRPDDTLHQTLQRTAAYTAALATEAES